MQGEAYKDLSFGLSKGSFAATLTDLDLTPLYASSLKTLQVNLGNVCNQSCKHCHVYGSPEAGVVMSRNVMEACLDALKGSGVETVDLTGGAPEMNIDLKWFVTELTGTGLRVIVRSNLSILSEEGSTELPEFFRDRGVEIVGSLPSLNEAVTDRVRGKGVFARSIEALKKLNALGYGESLVLNLACNPGGAFMAPPQCSLEKEFREELLNDYGIIFNSLFTITNMPVGRFYDFLSRSGNMNTYMQKLKGAFNKDAAKSVMCREMLSVGPDGSIYDCDFNQMLGLKCGYGSPDNISDFNEEKIVKRRIVVGEHCYGCTAGAGSSCGGAVATD
ncbi:MAG: arsenosugar biosynthesis radical SAM protein ArsS [Deltaproteobacteria bacterium]|nr:arsenosugar biosynthesis radical SAM protein ArsS [Deltaproteobacteria bacterium]